MGKEESKRIQTSILNRAEKIALVWLAQRQPRWVTSDFLTYMGVIGALVYALGCVLAASNIMYLWLASFGMVLNWYGDSLDGTLARVRNLQRPVYGFFIDNYRKIEAVILNDNNFVNLCVCLNNLSYLANMETINDNFSRDRESLFDNYDIMQVIESIAKQVFVLAVVNMESMKNLDEEEALKHSKYMKNLYSFSLENPDWCDIDIFNDKIDLMLDNTFGSSHIYAVCLAIKYKSGRLTADEFSSIVASFLESSDSEVVAYFLNGILLVARDILFINESIINSIDSTIKRLDEDKFLEVLPNFRYAFTNLSPTETERLSGIVANIYGTSKEKILKEVDASIEEVQMAISIDNKVFDLIKETL